LLNRPTKMSANIHKQQALFHTLLRSTAHRRLLHTPGKVLRTQAALPLMPACTFRPNKVLM
jgi:hypothetical protein